MSIVTWVSAGGLVGLCREPLNTRTEAIAFNAAVGVLGAASAGVVLAP
jgi:hypothetical protein